MELVQYAPLVGDVTQRYTRIFGTEAADALLVHHRTAQQRMAARLLLADMLGRPVDLAAHPSGRPYIVGSNIQVSLSHTQTHVAVMLSQHRAGIDVQTHRPKIMHMLDRFLDDEEQQCATSGGLPVATMLWCAKEAVYKAVDLAGLPFRDGIKLLGKLDSTAFSARVEHAGQSLEFQLMAVQFPDAAGVHIHYSNQEIRLPSTA